MPQTIPLQDSVVYGPIRSRRLGSSLGINVLPVTHKACSSNCVYCQYGWTLPPPVRLRSGRRPERSRGSTALTTIPSKRSASRDRGTPGPGAEPLRRSGELLLDIARAFEEHARVGTRVDCLTLAGNGEPTLHPDLRGLVVGIKALRDRHFPGAAVGILSDATQVMRPKVREALALLDARYMKFDAADEATWHRINDPLGRVDFQAMLEGLRTVPAIVLQSMFIQGAYENTGEPHLRSWVDRVGEIRPQGVQVYTVDRGTAAEGIIEVSRATLQAIADRLTAATGVPAEVFD